MEYTVQIKLHVIIDKPITAASLEDAIKKAETIAYSDLLDKGVTISDANKRVCGVFDNQWDVDV